MSNLIYKNKKNYMKIISFTKYLKEQAGSGDAASGGVGFATLNSNGMGNVITSQPSAIPGDTQGSTIGSGDIANRMGPYYKQYIKSNKRKKSKKRKNDNKI